MKLTLSSLALASLCLIGAAGAANADMIVRDSNNREYVVRGDVMPVSNPNYRYYDSYRGYAGYTYGTPERGWNSTAHTQSRLMMLGYWVGPEGANGTISNHTLDAIKKFQRAHGLKADGVVGERTASALDRATGRYGYGYGYAPASYYGGGYGYAPAAYYGGGSYYQPAAYYNYR